MLVLLSFGHQSPLDWRRARYLQRRTAPPSLIRFRRSRRLASWGARDWRRCRRRRFLRVYWKGMRRYSGRDCDWDLGEHQRVRFWRCSWGERPSCLSLLRGRLLVRTLNCGLRLWEPAVHSSRGSSSRSSRCQRIILSTLPMRVNGLPTAPTPPLSWPPLRWTVAKGLNPSPCPKPRSPPPNPAVQPILPPPSFPLPSLPFPRINLLQRATPPCEGGIVIFIKPMRTRRQGFQFSFGLKQEQPPSARSTPKFPSIEIPKAASERKQPVLHFDTEPVEVRRSPMDLFKDMGGGVEMIRGKQGREGRGEGKRLELGAGDALSVDYRDNKSVKSTKSLGERFLRKANKGGEGKTTKKQSNSLANILELKTDSPSAQDRRQLFKKLHHSPSKPPSQDTLKLQGSFFQTSPQNLQFRQTKKMLLTLERSKLQGKERGEGQRSRVFRHFLHKPRATLRFTPRGLNNERLESMSRRFEGLN